MLQDTLSRIETNTSMNRLNKSKRVKLTKILSLFKIGNIVYPGMIVRQTGLTINEVYSFLDQVEKLNIIEKAFEVQCTNCQSYTNELYNSLSEIPETIICEECEHEFHFPNGIIVVYRMINE